MGAETAAAELPRRFVRPFVLLLLREQPSHGYELQERLLVFGYAGTDPGGLYRTLRALEAEGHVRSSWERSSEGPDRRIYELTRAGMEHLHEHAQALDRTAHALDLFLSRYAEFVALAPDGARRPARR